ncbi:unnamed protein product, partial [Mesorhabditis spiculigera]
MSSQHPATWRLLLADRKIRGPSAVRSGSGRREFLARILRRVPGAQEFAATSVPSHDYIDDHYDYNFDECINDCFTTSTSTTETTESSPDPPLPVNSSESSPPPNATSASSSTTAKPSEQKPAKQPPTKLKKAKEDNREWYEIPWLWMVWGVAALFCCVCTCICYSMCCRRSVDPQNLDEPAFAPEFVNVEPMHHELGATEEALYCPRRSRTTWSIPTVISPSLTVDE